MLESRYSASRGLSKRTRATLGFPDRNRILHLDGIVVDTIQFCGTSLGELFRRTSISPDNLPRICIRWLKELKMNLEDLFEDDSTFSEEDKIEALWRTSVADIEMSPSWEKLRWRSEVPDFYKQMYRQNFPYKQMVEDESLKSHFTLMDVVNIARRPFISKQGFVGICPEDVLPGDQIVVFCGAEMPYILRTNVEGKSILIGDAYVHGIMDGLSEAREVQSFELH